MKILISKVASRQYGAVSSKIWSTEKIKTKKNWKFRKKPSHCSILPSHCSILPAHCSKLPAGYGVNSWYIKYINWCPREKPQYSENSIKPQRKICHLSPLALRALWLKWQIVKLRLGSGTQAQSGSNSGSVTHALTQWQGLGTRDSEPGLTLKSCRPPPTTHHPPTHNF